jgi:radical SAM protein with 4Fe4S-binding SPASM domain
LLRRWLDGDRPFAVTLGSTFTGLPAGSRDDGEGARTTESPDGPPRRFTADEPHCRHLFAGTAYVMPDARIIPCPRFIDTPVQDAMPSLLKVSLSEVWEDEALRGLLGLTKAEVLEHNPECAVCPQYDECGAGCWALGWAATGDRLGRDPEACETTREGYGRRLAAIAAEADSQ